MEDAFAYEDNSLKANSLEDVEDKFFFKIKNYYFLSASGFFMILNLVFDLLLSTLFKFILPDLIKKFREEQKSDEDLKLFSSALIDQTKGDKDTNLLNNSSNQILLANLVLRRNLSGEWKTNLLSIIQMLSTGLFTSCFMYLDLSTTLVLFNFSTTTNYRLNNTLILIHSLKTGYLLYKIIVVIIRFNGDSSTGLIISHLIYVIFIIESINSNRFILFVTFGYLNDLQSIFHFFKRAFIFIWQIRSAPYQICNIFNLILIIFLRPYVHFHQFNWLLNFYNYEKDFLWYLANLTATLHTLDTLFLLIEYINLFIGLFQEPIKIKDIVENLKNNRPIFKKLKKYDSDTDVVYF